MIPKHIETLNKTGLALIDKATKLHKVSEIERCIALGTELLQQARDILEQNKQNSILVFVEFALNVKINVQYKDYAEFCARNGLEVFSEADYLTYTSKALGVKSVLLDGGG